LAKKGALSLATNEIEGNRHLRGNFPEPGDRVRVAVTAVAARSLPMQLAAADTQA
jgi:hypothetical protein